MAALQDITNKPSPFRLHVDLDSKYCTLRSKHTGNVCFDTLRMQGSKAIDLWTDGKLYPLDPQSGMHPPFQTITSLLRFIGDGMHGLLGYCRRLHSQTLHEAARSLDLERTLQQAIGEISRLQEEKSKADKEREESLRQQRMQTQKVVGEHYQSFVRVTENYARLQNSTRNMRRRIDHFTHLPIGYHNRQRKRKALETLAKKGGARKKRLRATR